MRCEDYPCCGHTSGDPCPERDTQGRIVPRCVECNRRLPRAARSSICAPCQRDRYRMERDGDAAADYDR